MPTSRSTQPCAEPWDDCDNQDEDAVVAHVGARGPLAVCVNAHQWQHYASGVMSAVQCGGHDHASLDHCVQLVGYNGYDAGLGAAGGGGDSYWIVRNSWGGGAGQGGQPWGEQGLIYLAMGSNTCGVADVPTYVTFD